tara:strand:- start:202 stop:705 length:504 start_codon:yes stop_codon:yes gene_type:complete
MARDFLSSQIRTDKIIAADATSPQILVYPSTSATDNVGGTATDMLAKVGSDVFLFVSGSKCGKANNTPNSVALFGGDVVISGSLYVEQTDTSLWEEDPTDSNNLIPTNIIDGDTGLFAMDFSPLFGDSGNMLESSQYTMTNRLSVGDKFFEFDSDGNVMPRVNAVCS